MLGLKEGDKSMIEDLMIVIFAVALLILFLCLIVAGFFFLKKYPKQKEKMKILLISLKK